MLIPCFFLEISLVEQKNPSAIHYAFYPFFGTTGYVPRTKQELTAEAGSKPLDEARNTVMAKAP